MHRAVAKATRPQVPAAIGAERRLHHRRSDAGDVVAVRIDRRHQNRVALARKNLRRLLQNPAFRLGAEIQQRQRIGLVRDGPAGN